MTKRTDALVVDDLKLMRRRIRELLGEHDFERILEAASAAEAVEQYRTTRPMLVTMDLVMSRSRGLDALMQILNFDPDAQIIVVSGMYQESLLMDALAAGAMDFVIKPFSNNHLHAAIRRALGTRTDDAAPAPIRAVKAVAESQRRCLAHHRSSQREG